MREGSQKHSLESLEVLFVYSLKGSGDTTLDISGILHKGTIASLGLCLLPEELSYFENALALQAEKTVLGRLLPPWNGSFFSSLSSLILL